MEAWLAYRHKFMEFDFKRRQKVSRSEKVLLYSVLSEKPKIIKTFQGFVTDLIALADGEYDFSDRRAWFPEPDYTLAKGFRCAQEQLFQALHSFNRSGIVQAPTRYGKSTLIANTMRIFPKVKTVLAAPGVDLLGQLVEDMQKKLPQREVVGIFSGAKGKKVQSDDITVTSLDSLHKIDAEGTKLLLIDEPHAAVSESRAPELARFKNARIYGFGATVDGRYDGADKLIHGLIGPVLAKRTFTEAVVEGAICPIKVWMVHMQFDPYTVANRDIAYKQLIYANKGFNDMVKYVSDKIIPPDYQTVIFADEVKQIGLMNQFVTDGVPAIAMKMKKNERKELFDRMVSGEIKRCIATDIFSTGVTFPDIRVIVNAASGGSGISSTQKPGRLAEIRPGKTCGHLIDFHWECVGFTPEDLESSEFDRQSNQWSWVVRDSYARVNTYKALGYEVKHVNSIDEIQIT